MGSVYAASAAWGVFKGSIRYSRGTFDWDYSFFPDYVLGDGIVQRAINHLSLNVKNVGSVLDGGAGKTRKNFSLVGEVYFTDWVLIK